MSEVKIRLSKYSMFFAKQWASTGAISEEQALDLMEQAQEIVGSHLICTNCNQILPDEEFYRQQAQTARRGRSQECKACWKETRGRKKFNTL